MLSFIIIGRNEGVNLSKCFISIYQVIKSLNLQKVEIIYIDSHSSDNSIKIASQYATDIVSIFGNVNAAIARNVGAKIAKGDYFIFLDGDMEIQSEFMIEILDSKSTPKYPYVTGDLLNIYFDSFNNCIGQGPYYKEKLKRDEYLPYTGGFFCIERSLWENEKGMQEKYRRSQDLDFGFRLAKKGILILRKKELAIKHNTVSYYDQRRARKILLMNDFGYRAMLYRDHFFNKSIYRMLFRSDYSFIFLFFLSIISIISGHFELFLLYLILIITRAFAQPNTDKIHPSYKSIFLLIKDVQMVFSFVFFFPTNRKSYKIEKIK